MGQSDWPKNFADQPDGSQQPTALGNSRNFEVDDPVEPDHHSQAREDLRMIQRWQSGKSKQPLRIINRVDSPGDVVNSGGYEDETMKFSAG